MKRNASSARLSRPGAGLVLLGVIAAVMGIMPAALAHHPEIAAQAACDVNTGAVTVSGTSQAWSDCSGDGQCGHGDIRIQFDNFGGGSNWYDVASGSYAAGNTYQFNWGPIAWPAGATGVYVRAYAVGDWNNGADGGASNTTVSRNFPAACGGHVIVDKVTYPSTESDFDFDPSWGSDFVLDDTDTPKDSGVLPSGTHSVVEEDLPSGWVQIGATCSDGSPVSAISLQAGETVTCTFHNTNKGRIVIDKVTDPVTGDDPDFTFTRNWVGGTFSLDDNDSAYDTGWTVSPGTHTVVESALAGWDLTDLTCVDPTQNSSGNVGTGTAGINVAAGETVVCTFTNSLEWGRIIVDKVTVPGGSEQKFEFTPDWDGPFSLADGDLPYDSGLLAPGGYSVSEAVPEGWDLISAACVVEAGESGPTFEEAVLLDEPLPMSPADITLGPGQTVRCTFTNTERGRIIVDKVTVPGGSNQAFGFEASWDELGFPLTDTATPHDSGYLEPGGYSVSETVPGGWSLASAVCSDQSNPADINLDPGETVVCTFTNTQITRGFGIIIVDKVTDPAGSLQPFEFDPSWGPNLLLTGPGAPVASGALEPGTYSVSEVNIPAQWSLDSAACSDGSLPSAIGLSAGETVTCTFANSLEQVEKPRGSLTIVKEATPQDDTPFRFAGDFGPFSLLDPSGASRTFTELDAGTYAVTELALPAGWQFDGITCDGLEWSAQGRSVTVNLAEGESAVCTFANSGEEVLGPTGSLTILKQTNPAGGEGFSFTTSDGLSGPFTLDDGGSVLFSELEPGVYTVAEDDPGADWAFQSVQCEALDWSSDGRSVTVNLAEGEAAVCTFYNVAELPLTGGSSLLLPLLVVGLGALAFGTGMLVRRPLGRRMG